MRKKKRNLMHWLLLFIIMLTVHSSVIFAAENDNTTAETATTINVNTSYSDNLTDSSDVNWYKFTLSDDGAISLEFTHDYLESSNSFWKAYLYDSSQNELVNYSYKGDTSSYVGEEIAAPTGIYYLKIVDSSYSDLTYNLKINFDTKSDTPSENPFVDVSKDDYYYDAVLWAYENGITTGKDDTHFQPSAPCNRAQSVTFLWRAFGKPEPETTNSPFVDVTTSDYYYKAVLWAYENGITNGKDATHFQPDDKCIRAQVVSFLYRYFN